MAQRQPREIFGRLQLRPLDWSFVAAGLLGAAAVAALIALPVPTTYRTTSVVGLDPSADGANERVDFVADMRAAVYQPSVLDTVAEDVGIPRSVLTDDLSVQTVNDSNLIRIVYEPEDRDPEVATEVVRAVPRGALEFLREGELSAAEQASAAAQQAFDDAADRVASLRDDLDAALADNDFIRPDDELESIRRELEGARIALLGLDQQEDAEEIRAIETVIEALESQIADAAEDAARYAALENDLAIAVDDRRSLATDLNDARQGVAAAAVGPSVTVQTVASERSDERIAVLQVVGLPLVVGLVVIGALSWYRGRRAARTG